MVRKPDKRVRISYIKGKSLGVLSAERRDWEKDMGRLMDPEFKRMLYIDYMSDPTNRVDPKAKQLFIDAYDVPYRMLQRWDKDKDTQAEIRKVVRERFGGGERIKELYDALWEQARSGRISAIRLGLEVTGEYTPKLQHIDRPKNLEDYLDKMDKRDEKEDTVGTPARVTRH